MALKTGTWPGFIARTFTPAIPSDTLQLLADAWPAVVGTEASRGELLACLAQIMLETGERQSFDQDHQAFGYWNGNCGNLRGEYASQWTSFNAGEGYGKNQILLPPGPNNRFRSYLGVEDDVEDPDVLRHARMLGIRDYLSLLNRKYPKALEKAALADYTGFVHELHVGGYFTANESAYASAEEKLRYSIATLPLLAAFLKDSVDGT